MGVLGGIAVSYERGTPVVLFLMRVPEVEEGEEFLVPRPSERERAVKLKPQTRQTQILLGPYSRTMVPLYLKQRRERCF